MDNDFKNIKPSDYSPLTLAFIGDGVYDLLVRSYVVNLANRPVGELNKIKVSFVNCKAQAEFMKKLMPQLTEQELSVYKRGRNAATSNTPKNSSVADYHSATGFEALFGYLYITKQNERIEQLFNIIKDTAE
ncbi:MAG: ribonuclease III domain-containing protein [Oscillospiraceae bacterium]|nr:ribonuclease III domain-containing protein [Oscillospiraceae bacterium]